MDPFILFIDFFSISSGISHVLIGIGAIFFTTETSSIYMHCRWLLLCPIIVALHIGLYYVYTLRGQGPLLLFLSGLLCFLQVLNILKDNILMDWITGSLIIDLWRTLLHCSLYLSHLVAGIFGILCAILSLPLTLVRSLIKLVLETWFRDQNDLTYNEYVERHGTFLKPVLAPVPSLDQVWNPKKVVLVGVERQDSVQVLFQQDSLVSRIEVRGPDPDPLGTILVSGGII